MKERINQYLEAFIQKKLHFVVLGFILILTVLAVNFPIKYRIFSWMLFYHVSSIFILIHEFFKRKAKNLPVNLLIYLIGSILMLGLALYAL